MNKILIIGNFGGNKEQYDGQTIKTKNIYNELVNNLSESNIIKIDSFGGFDKLINYIFLIIKNIESCNNVIILPAQRNLCILSPILYLKKLFNKNFKVHYIVIGGWLANYIKQKFFLKTFIKSFYKIYVETNSMKLDLKNLEINNTIVFPNFKNIKIISTKNIYNNKTKIKFCTFSRVMKKKGITKAIEVINEINLEHKDVNLELDIYGVIDNFYKEEFNELINKYSDFVNYKGCIEPEKSVDILKDYFMLLFPTEFYTEGIPGTILDSYAAGLPVICPFWLNYKDVFEDNINGLGYDFYNENGLKEKIIYAINNQEFIFHMKDKCIKKAYEYLPNNIIKILLKELK